ncbi:OmpA family protein [Croceiramulus getboli]|nr:OmpA family protein [Flavobacteriaceae bacterium YJPT1-3]
MIRIFTFCTISLLVLSCGQEHSTESVNEVSAKSTVHSVGSTSTTFPASKQPSQTTANVTETYELETELDLQLNDLKPLLQMHYGLSGAEIDKLVEYSEQKASLKAESLLDSEAGKQYWAELDQYLTALEQTEREGKASIEELRNSIFRKPQETEDPITISVREGIKKIPKEFLREDGLVEPSFIEHELRKEEFWDLVEKMMVERQMTFNPDAVDDETLARVFDVTEEEVHLMKATPAFAKPQSTTEAKMFKKEPLSPNIEQHLKGGKATPSFEAHMNRLRERRVNNASTFIKRAQVAEQRFYDLNPNWFHDQEGISETYLSNQGTYVFLPLGTLSFADRVISHYIGINGGGANASDALNEPDFDENTNSKMSNLGLKGVLILEFKDNVLIDVNGPDLFVFEIGVIESTRLEISENGSDWIEVGKISGGTAQVDIGPFVRQGQSFNYVRFTDLETQSMLPGADIDAVATIGGALRLSLDSAVLFDTGKHELKPEGIIMVEELATQMQNFIKGTVTVEGHTDDVGSAQNNFTLSKRRAASVATALKKSLGQSGLKWKEVGLGETKPLVPNDTESNRQKNRRVEILVTPF